MKPIVECHGHCYCQATGVGDRPHVRCCNCGHQRLDRTAEMKSSLAEREAARTHLDEITKDE